MPIIPLGDSQKIFFFQHSKQQSATLKPLTGQMNIILLQSRLWRKLDLWSYGGKWHSPMNHDFFYIMLCGVCEVIYLGKRWHQVCTTQVLLMDLPPCNLLYGYAAYVLVPDTRSSEVLCSPCQDVSGWSCLDKIRPNIVKTVFSLTGFNVLAD